MQIDHIAIWANDLEKEKHFYQTYFDCKVSAKYENAQKQFTSYFLIFLNGARIELMKRNNITSGQNEDHFGFAHIAINVGTRDKVEHLTKKMEKDGLVIVSYPRVTGDGYYESVVLDPENNKIEITAIENYKISDANYEDLAPILYLQKCCYLPEAEIYNDYSIPPLTQKIEDIKSDFEKQTILKLEYSNKIIGSVRGFLRDGTCYIGKLIVDKDYQNMGFGKQLLEAFEGKFKNAGRFELFTGVKSSKNLFLYNKLGYKEFKEEKLNEITIKYLEKVSDNDRTDFK
jgi:catechol 2,3-dioxygenase-like lactoylglutathione lyase family enzyme/GNAT superfamily N-acetyltransferase